MPKPDDYWFLQYSNIVLMVRFMAENDFEPSEIASAVEKPWNAKAIFDDALADAVSD